MAFWRKIPAASDVLSAPPQRSRQRRDPPRPVSPMRDVSTPSSPVNTSLRDATQASRLGTLLKRRKSRPNLVEQDKVTARAPDFSRAPETTRGSADGSLAPHWSSEHPLAPSASASVLRSDTSRHLTSSHSEPAPPKRRPTVVYTPTNPDADVEPSDDGLSLTKAELGSHPAAPVERESKQLNPVSLYSHDRFPPSCPPALPHDAPEEPVYHRSSPSHSAPPGIQNLGNTCYMASALQCLAVTPSLASFLTSGDYKTEINHENPQGTQGAVSRATAKLFRSLQRARMASVDPSPFFNTFVYFHPDFDSTDQQDAQEFLGFLLDSLHEDLNLAHSSDAVAPLSRDEVALMERLPEVEGAALAWDRYLGSNDSVIVDLFHGLFRNKLRCLTCHRTSTTFNLFQVLSLPIPLPAPGEHDVELADCFNAFLQGEMMKGDDAWNCPRCRQPRATRKWMSISRLPESTLIIHLKRFASSLDGSLMGIDTPVIFPVEELDLSSLLPRAPQDGPRTLATFTLCAVVNHRSALRDELDSGHYTAMVKSHGRWYQADDELVHEIDVEAVAEASRSAYLLFYSRQIQ